MQRPRVSRELLADAWFLVTVLFSTEMPLRLIRSSGRVDYAGLIRPRTSADARWL